MLGAEVAIDDRHMAARLCVVMNSGGVVGRIHQIVEIGDAGAGHGHQGNGDPDCRGRKPEVSTQETGIWPQATSRWSL
jgi:hypothetical protein